MRVRVIPPIVNLLKKTPSYADKSTPLPRAHTHVSRWRIARAGGVGSACGMIMSEGLLGHGSIFHKPLSEIVPFLFSVAIMVFVGFALIEPFIAWLEHGNVEHGHDKKRTWLQKIVLVAVVLVLSLLFTVFEDLHRETLVHRHMLSGWIVAMLVGWLATYAWVLGAQHGFPRATIYGTLMSLSIGVASTILIAGIAILTNLDTIKSASDVAPLLIMLITRNVGGWTLYGLVGGLAIDFGRGLPATIRVTIGLTAAALVMALANPILADESSAIFSDVFRVMGWGLALVIYPPANIVFSEARLQKPKWSTTVLAVVVALILAAILSAACWVTVYWQHERFYGEVTSFGSHSAPVTIITPLDDDTLATAAFSRGGQTLDTTDLSIRIWGLTAAAEANDEAEKRRIFAYNAPLAALEADSHVMNMQLSDLHAPHHEHNRLWSASIDGTVVQWDTERCVPTFRDSFTLPNVPTEKLRPQHNQTLIRSAALPTMVRFRHDGRQLLVADNYSRIHTFSIAENFGKFGAALTLKLENTLDIPGNGITALRYSHHGELALIGTLDGEVLIANLEPPPPPTTSPAAHSENAEHVSLITLRNTAVMPSERRRINDVAMSNDETLLAAAGEDGHIYVWNLRRGSMWPPLSNPPIDPAKPLSPTNPRGPFTGVAFTPDGRHLASSCTDGARAFAIWDCLTNSEVFIGPQIGGASTVTIFADGARAASGSPSGSIAVWRIPRF